MPIEPFEITTVYPDGTTETRMSSLAEMAQREADIAAFEAEKQAQEQALAERENARASAMAKFKALGLSDAEIQAILP